ncbi:erythromycin esterase family protein [Paenibacillus chitinolyticus]|uniref:erythromycin esterase family protein n=1 Tax=Paenibacillus chitinolyticus TaxID=79263 RepID=UPI003556B114
MYSHHLKLKTIKTTIALTIAAVCAFPAAGMAAADTAADSKPPAVSTTEQYGRNWANWIQSHAYALDRIQPETSVKGVIEKDRFKDLEFLKPLLIDKKLVYLGENTHGTAEYSSSKVRLIQYLHQELGYDVIAFESGLGNASAALAKSADSTPEQMMKEAIFGVWWSKETLPLFDYIKQTLATDKPLILSGFDMQIQSPYSEFVRDWIGSRDAKLAGTFADAEQELGDWSFSEDEAGYAKAKPRLLETYESMKTFVKENADKLKADYPRNPHLIEMTQRVLDDRIEVIRTYTEANIRSNIALKKNDISPFRETVRMRDEIMANNLTWLAEQIYPDKKIIVWGHNVHIRKKNSAVLNSGYTGLSLMGESMPARLKRQSYVIGLYTYQGEAANNMGQSYPIVKPERGSLEDILKQHGHPYTFVDIKYRKDKPGTSWMFEPRLSLDWGLMQESFIPRDQFDGLLLIDTVHAPSYMRGKPGSQ